MKLFHRNNPLASLLIISLLLIGNSCERNENINIPGFDCADCYQLRPEWVRLNVALTINGENPSIPLTLYIGNIEDGNIDWIDTSFTEDYWVDVKPDRYYSVKAEYKDGASIVYAIDGDNIKLKHNTNDCDQPCYYQSGGYIDVRLK